MGARSQIAILAALATVALWALPATGAAGPVQCGDTITRDTTLHTDVLCSFGGVALTIGADRVTLDLGGHSVNEEIVVDGHNRVTIRNGRPFAVTLRDSNRSRLLDLHLGVGAVTLENSDRNLLQGNRILSTSGGIRLISSDRNLIRANDVQGIQNQGVGMDEGSDGNFLVGNSIRGEQATGVRVAGSRNTLLANDVLTGSGFSPSAIVVAGGVRNRVIYNDATAPSPDLCPGGCEPFGGVDAIFIDAASIRTLVLGNVAHDSGDDGIDVESPTTKLKANTANSNGDLGIEAVAGLRGARGNTAEANGNPLQCLNVFCR